MGWGKKLGAVALGAALFVCHGVEAKLAPRNKNQWNLDAGVFANNLRERWSAPAGYTTLVSTVSGFLRLRRDFHLGKSVFFEPSFALALPWRSGEDGSTKVFTFHWGADFSLPLFSFLRVRLGPGVHWLLHTSTGEAVPLNNGTSTSTFYTPARMTSSLLLAADFGIEVVFSRRLSLSFETYTTAIASPSLRRFHGAILLGWVL